MILTDEKIRDYYLGSRLTAVKDALEAQEQATLKAVGRMLERNFLFTSKQTQAIIDSLKAGKMPEEVSK